MFTFKTLPWHGVYLLAYIHYSVHCFFWAVIVHYWNTVQDLHLKQCSDCDSKLVWALFPQKTVLQILRGQKSRTVSGWFYMPKRSSLTLLRLYSDCGVSTSDFRMRSNYGGISILQRAKTSQPWFIFKENNMKRSWRGQLCEIESEFIKVWGDLSTYFDIAFVLPLVMGGKLKRPCA